MASGPAHVDTLTAATLDRYVSNVAEDQIFGQMRTLKLLISKGRKADGGGSKIRQPLLYREGFADEFQDWDTLPSRRPEIITDAEYDRVNYEGDLVLNKFRLIENRGKERRLNYAKEMADTAMLSIRNKLQNHFVTQTTTGANRLTTIHDLMNPLDTTIGGFSGVTYDWWQPQSSTQVAFITGDVGMDAFQTVYNDCQKRTGQTPDLGPMHQTVWEAFARRWRPNIRLSDEKMLEAGIENIKYNSLTCYFEPDMGTPQIGGVDHFPAYMINSNHIKLWVVPEYDFTRTPDITPDKQPQIFLSYILWRGAIGMSCRNASGRVMFSGVA